MPAAPQISPELQQTISQGIAAEAPRNLGLEYARGMTGQGLVPDLRQMEALTGLGAAPAPALGEVLDVGGVPFVRTNPNQITPLPRPDAPKLDRGTQLNQLIREREAWKAEGRDDVVAQYDSVIERMGRESGIDVGALVAALTGKAAAPGGEAKPAAAAPGSAATPAKPAPAAKSAAEPAEQPRKPSAAVPKAEGARVRQNGKLYEMRVGKWTEVSE